MGKASQQLLRSGRTVMCLWLNHAVLCFKNSCLQPRTCHSLHSKAITGWPATASQCCCCSGSAAAAAVCVVSMSTAYNPVPETTGTAMFAYAMSYGIKAGLLDPATYLPVVEKAWSCLTTVSLHPDGKLGNCQPGGSAPQRNFGPETTNSFCVGQFAMAAAGVAQLAQ